MKFGKNMVFLFLLFIISEETSSFPNSITNKERNSNDILKRNQRSAPPDSSDTQHYSIAQFNYDHVRIPFLITVWLLSACLFKILFKITPKLSHILPESCLLILIGLAVGSVMRFGFNVKSSPLTAKIFFLYILPPIIFDAGYFMPNRMFFNNFGTILLMAVVGTIFNIFAIGSTLWTIGLSGVYGSDVETPNLAATLLFTSVIAATDPVAVLAVFDELQVNELLYIVVFGESLLNDAVTVVVYHVLEVFNNIGVENAVAQDFLSGFISFFVLSSGGTLIGIIWGYLTGFLSRFTHNVLIVEPLFVFLMAYISYLNAEIFNMSSILAITFCGLTMKSYVEMNVTKNSKITIHRALKMISNSAESLVFILLGVATIEAEHVWNTWFVVVTILCCSIFRVLTVIVLVPLSNRFRLHRLNRNDQTIMCFGGLRGAVSFALVLLIDERNVKQRDMFLTTTLVVIFFTVFIQGISVKPILKWLKIKLMEKREMTLKELIFERFIDHLMAGIECIAGNNGDYCKRAKFRRINKRYIEPLLLRDLKKSERKLIEAYVNAMKKDALKSLSRCGSTNLQDEDIPHDARCGNNLILKKVQVSMKRKQVNNNYPPSQGTINHALDSDTISRMRLNSI